MAEIHPLADVRSNQIGNGTNIWQFSVILEKAVIGEGCNINCHVFIENDVVLGNFVTVKSGVYLWDGIRAEDYVFIGPNVTFTNDKTPRSKQYPTGFRKTILRHHASIGAGSILLGDVEIGEYAMIGAGSLVTKNVPPRALVLGSPAKIAGWVNEDGSRMNEEKGIFTDTAGIRWKVVNNALVKF